MDNASFDLGEELEARENSRSIAAGDNDCQVEKSSVVTRFCNEKLGPERLQIGMDGDLLHR
jgi:hypothetical protein